MAHSAVISSSGLDTTMITASGEPATSLLGDVADDLGVDLEQVHAAHAGLARQARGDDADVGARGLVVAVGAHDAGLEALDRPALHHVERQALRLALDDVGHDDLVGVVGLGDALDERRTVEAAPHDGDLHCTSSLRRRTRNDKALYRRSTIADANSERLHLGGALHQAGEVVGDDLVGDGRLEGAHDVVGRVLPAEVLEHHHAREQHRAGVDLVLAGVLRRGAVGGLEDAVAGDVVDVAAGGDADAADLGGQRVGQVVAVEVGGGDHVELVGPGEHLLQGDVGDGVLHEDLVAGLAAAVVPAHGDVGELLAHELVAPVAEGALGELQDVALVHERHALAALARPRT